jgi:membrane dipeptidase
VAILRRAGAAVVATGVALGAALAAEAVDDRARRLARELLIVDTHIDVPYRLLDDPEDVAQRTNRGDFDAVRARQGGLDVVFQSIFIPASYQKGGAKLLADQLIDMVESIARHNPETFAVVASTAAAEAASRAGRIAFALGMENGAPIGDDLENLRHFHRRGVRYITLTHGEDNQISDSSYAPADKRTWKGISPFGRQVVAEMNRLGVMVDISHVSDQAFDQVIELSRAPVIASHSSCRRFTPGWERNLDDARIRKLAAKGGVLQIAVGSAFLTRAANEYSSAQNAAQRKLVADRGGWMPPAELDAFRERYRRENPYPYATLDDVFAHIDHVRRIAGIDHVGIGSDFDGVGDSLPVGLKDVSMYPNLVAKLLAEDYSEADIAKVLGGNLMRVWREVETVAARAAKPNP